MKRITILFVTLLCLALFPEAARQQNHSDQVAIVGATVIDGTGAEPKKQTVIIKGDRIEAVIAADAKPPSNARVINAEGLTLMPGIFDLHTHLPYASGGGIVGDWSRKRRK